MKIKDLHSHSVSTKCIENVGGSGKVQHKFGRTRMCHSLSLLNHNNNERTVLMKPQLFAFTSN